MPNYFIQKIEIKQVRNIQNFEIPLSQESRTHLIITGKNGSGKTSLILEINNLLNKLINNSFQNIESHKKNLINQENAISNAEKQIKNLQSQINQQEEQKKNILNSGNNKETVDNAIKQIDNHIKSYNTNIINLNAQIEEYKKNVVNFQTQIDDFSKVNLIFSNESEIYKDIVSRKFILAYFAAKRENTPTVSQSIKNINIQPNYNTDTKNLHKQFIEYMVKLRTDMLDAKEENEQNEVQRIASWFQNFENSLKELFGKNELKLKYYRKELNFKIEYDDLSFGLNELSDGYSSLLAILTELILRMEAHSIRDYTMQGVVLIDEIETHLHVSLQKKVLPFLISFFPNIQFIATTHSPFVLSSLSNAIICDLEKRFITQDLTGYSYESLVDSYFDTDKYSKDVKEKLKRYEELTLRDNSNLLNTDETKEFLNLEAFFEILPKYQNEEINFHYNRIKQFKDGNV